MKESKVNGEKFDEFIEGFNGKIYPTVVGDDGEGASLFRSYIAEKRKRIEERRKLKETKM